MSKPSANSPELANVLAETGMWRASAIDCAFRSGTPTGFGELDHYLPGGGWPPDGITELIHGASGIGELRLLVPALAHLSQIQNRSLLWVSPPYIPYAPALASAGIDLSRILLVRPGNRKNLLWVLEKALASRSCSAVLAWPGQLRETEIRRLQVASKDGHCLGVLFRDVKAVREASPAELRIYLEGMTTSPLVENSGIRMRILKRRGGWPTEMFSIDFRDKLTRITPDFPELIINRHSTRALHGPDIDRPFAGTASHDLELT